MKDDIKALLNEPLKLTRVCCFCYLISSTNLRFTTRLFRVLYAL